MNQMTYRPGTSTAVVSSGGAVMVRDGESLAAELWNVVNSDSWTGGQVLEVLTAGGLASVPQFCAVVIGHDTATLLTRGECSFTVHDESGVATSDGRTVSTWIERSIPWSTTTAVELKVGNGGGESDLPIASGVVLAAHLTVGLVPEPKPEPEPEVEAEVELEASGAESAPGPVLPAELPESEAVEMGALEPELPEDEPVEVAVKPPALSDPNATLADADGSRFDAIFGATVPGRRLEDAAVRESADQAKPVAPLPEGLPVDAPTEDAGDHDGHTMSAAELARLRATREAHGQATAPSPTPSIAPPPSAPAVTLKFSTGKTLQVDRPVVIGRSPRAHGSTSAEVPHLVVIDNPYISGTHLLVSVDDGVVVVTDMSTNGTLLQRPDGPPLRLDKGRETVVVADTVLNLSDDISVTVVSGGSA